MTLSPDTIQDLATEYAEKSPQQTLQFAFDQIENPALAFSGAEDVVLIDMAVQIKKDVSVFCLDTGRLHPETYRFIQKVRDKYQVAIQLLSPNYELVEKLVREKGLFSFYQDGHQECCGIRKVEPLKRHLTNYQAWITGQRKDQSPDTRAAVPTMQIDKAFSTESKTMYKFNPLANWSSEKVWNYIRENDVPYNELHDQGFKSIGCEPCTRAVKPDQHERAGRWWWEEATKKECGLHVSKE